MSFQYLRACLRQRLFALWVAVLGFGGLTAVWCAPPALAQAEDCQAHSGYLSPDDVVGMLGAFGAEGLEEAMLSGNPFAGCVLQYMLKHAGQDLATDGAVGPATRAALRRFHAQECGLANLDTLTPASITCYQAGLGDYMARAKQQGNSAPATVSPTRVPPATAPQAAQTPSGCKVLADSSDPDIKRNLAALNALPLCYQLETIREGGRAWLVQSLTHQEKPNGPAWVLPHDNEDAAFDAAVYALQRYGGQILTFHTGERRSFNGQDANRIFARARSDAAACAALKTPHPKVTDYLLQRAQQSRYPLLSMHTNSDGYSGNGGSGTISILRDSSVLQAHPSRYTAGGLRDDEDNMILVAGQGALANHPALQRFIAIMNADGIHVMYEKVTPEGNDCSYSNYIVLHNLGSYYNIEVQDGNVRRAKELIDRLISYVN